MFVHVSPARWMEAHGCGPWSPKPDLLTPWNSSLMYKTQWDIEMSRGRGEIQPRGADSPPPFCTSQTFFNGGGGGGVTVGSPGSNLFDAGKSFFGSSNSFHVGTVVYRRLKDRVSVRKVWIIGEASSLKSVLIVLMRGGSRGLGPVRRRQVALCIVKTFTECLVSFGVFCLSHKYKCVLFFLLWPPELREQPLFTTKVSDQTAVYLLNNKN